MVHNMMKRLIFAALVALAPSAAYAQNCNGQAGAGAVCGNDGASTGFPSFKTLSPLLDRNFGSTQGLVLNRGASAWTATKDPVLGLPGTSTGSLGFASAGGGTATVSPRSTASALSFFLPTTAGTFPSTASSPLALDGTTGVLSCPTCVTGPTPAGEALTVGNDTNVTLTLGGSPTNALVNAASVTAGWTGQLGLTRGGTNAGLTASNGGLVYSDASALAILAGTATAGQVPRSGSSAAPSWSTATYPDTAAAGTVLAASSANTVAGTATPTLGVAGSLLGSIALAGDTSGTVTITPQAAAGTYNFNLPTSAGTSGKPLLSAGGGASPMTFDTLGVTGGGTGLAAIAAGEVLNGSAPNTITATSTPTLGTNGGTGGQITFNGATSGSVALSVAAAAGTGTVFQLPATNGTNGYFLQTDGAGVTSWSAATGTGDVVGPASATDNAAARFDLTTGKLIQNSALIVADTTGALSRSGNGGIPVQGTNTNDSASAGDIGEYVSSTVTSGSAVSLTNATTANITSISLTAGDWDVRAAIYILTATTTNVTQQALGVSSTSATVDTTPGRFLSIRYAGGAVPGAGGQDGFGLPNTRFSLSSTTTIYLVANCNFTVSTMSAYGIIAARRVR